MIGASLINGCRRWLWLGILAAVLFGSIADAESNADDLKPLQKSDIAEIIDSLVTAYELHYVYPDTARALSEYIRKRFADGEYDDATDLTTIIGRLRDDFRSFTHDRHIYISVLSPDDTPAIGDTVTDAEIARRARTNFKIRKAEWLVGNVGYLRLDGFNDAAYAGEALASAMGFLARCDAVILDLRYNGGGDETMVRFLASYFFKKPIIINALYFPETDSLEQSWTYSFVPGHKLVDADLYILTSSQTASGAEAFSYGMKNAGRAILIGETTAGAAHWTESWDFPNLQIRANIPIARPINPVTKTSWERTGVTPDIEVPSENALIIAHRRALEGMLDRTTDDDLRSELTWYLVALEAQTRPITLGPEKMITYTGEFADGHYAILVKDGTMFWRYVDGTEFKLIPFSEDLFGFEDTDEYRLAIVRDDNGLVTGFRLLVQGSDPGPIREKTGDIQ
jgi:hypothetical protein